MTDNQENRKAMEAIRRLLGSWPANDLRRVFVEGVEWWEFQQEGHTSLGSADRAEAEAEAEKRYPGGQVPVK